MIWTVAVLQMALARDVNRLIPLRFRPVSRFLLRFELRDLTAVGNDGMVRGTRARVGSERSVFDEGSGHCRFLKAQGASFQACGTNRRCALSAASAARATANVFRAGYTAQLRPYRRESV